MVLPGSKQCEPNSSPRPTDNAVTDAGRSRKAPAQEDYRKLKGFERGRRPKKKKKKCNEKEHKLCEYIIINMENKIEKGKNRTVNACRLKIISVPQNDRHAHAEKGRQKEEQYPTQAPPMTNGYNVYFSMTIAEAMDAPRPMDLRTGILAGDGAVCVCCRFFFLRTHASGKRKSLSMQRPSGTGGVMSEK